MTVKAATPNMQGADIDSVLSLAKATELKANGIDFVLRYAPRQLDTYLYNLTNPEMLRILQAGIALMVVQHVANDGWEPTEELGASYGKYMADFCTKTIQLPKGVNVWLDLEMVKIGTPIADTISYATAWWDAVNAAGYVPGLYVGYQPGLTAEELYKNLPFRSYWRSYNYDDGVSTRGFCMIQHPEKTIAGLQIDPDTIQADQLGGLPFLLFP
jgi:hypothetical protein